MSPLANLLSCDELYIAGQHVTAGRYRNVETGREVCLEHQDFLPASLDGRVAVYVCVEYTWERIQPYQMPAAPLLARHKREDK